MRPNWSKLASLAQKTYTLDSFQFFGVILVPKDNLFIEHTHTHTHTHTELKLGNTHAHTHMLTHTCSHTHAYIHTHACTGHY